MHDYKLNDTNVAKKDVFSLNQCPKNDFEKKEMQKIPYVLVVESLMYTQVYTRADIAYVTRMLGKYLSNLGVDHSKATKQYCGTSRELTYQRSYQHEIIGYIDSDFVGR